MKSFEIRQGALSLALTALLAQSSIIALLPPAYASDNRVRIGGTPVITVSTTSTEKADTIQHNIDNSLVASNNRSPSSVKITYVKGLPVLTLGGYYVAKVDNATARAAGTTPTLLAQKWAAALKTTLANKSNTDAYIAQLTGTAIASSSKSSPAKNKIASSSIPSPKHRPSANPKLNASTAKKVSSQSGWQPMPSATASGDAGQSSSGDSEISGQHQYQGRVVYIPAGMTIPAKLMTALTSDAARAGDTIVAKTTQDITLSNGVIPANSTLIGQVTVATSGTRLAHSGSLGIKFNTLRTPNGADTPISAHVSGNVGKYSDHGGDLFRGEDTGAKVKKSLVATALGAGGGTVLGLTIGAIAGGGRGAGRGALSGAAIGAGLGLAESLLLRKGSNVTMPQGQDISLQLDAPVSLAMN